MIDGEDQECVIRKEIGNQQRTFGATLSHAIARKFNDDGLPDGRRIRLELSGHGGQSFCAFLTKGVKVTLEGDANDYVCKVLGQKYSFVRKLFHYLPNNCNPGFVWRRSECLPSP